LKAKVLVRGKIVKQTTKVIIQAFRGDLHDYEEGEFIMKMLMAYFKDESGQTSTEYILLVAVVAMIVFKFKSIATQRLGDITSNVFGNADKMVQDSAPGN
jgi:pilus assembly protein Flp/PilA